MTILQTWLRELQLARKGGVRLQPAATRGRPWNARIVLAGDWSGASMRGCLRLTPDAAGAVLANFNVSPPELEGDFTAFVLSLDGGNGSNSTGRLPADQDADGVEEFAFDILLTPQNGTEDLLFGGILPVIGRITL
ncbi:MAG: hypothetical protein WA908_01445 [Pontixanthobacter sp.]